MRLVTLGKLQLEGTNFTRVKPLLLLSYLALEGVKDRRYIAEFFWPTAADSLNSLSRALSQLRKGAPGAIDADEQRIWATVDCDAVSFKELLERKNHSAALQLYGGAFLEAAYLSDWGVELEEWIYETRETLAGRAQRALLAVAEADAAAGRFSDAAKLAETAYELDGAPLPEPEELTQFYTLLAAGDSYLTHKLKDEAASYDINLELSPAAAQTRLQATFIGRAKERAALSGLSPGQFGWVQGAAGMGKSTLLKSLSGTYLAAKRGLPYATLEPLLGNSTFDGEAAMLATLSALEGCFMLDAWEDIDSESKTLLERASGLNLNACIIIAARARPAFNVDTTVTLQPLSQPELERFEGAWTRTGGLPALVGAYLRAEPLEAALEQRLDTLSTNSKQVYLALALLGEANPTLVRRALALSAADMASAFETLIQLGLADASGQIRAQAAAQDYLSAHPLASCKLALGLARELTGVDAYPLYSQAKLLWEDPDLPGVTEAYLAWASELLRRGFPQRATEVLIDAPNTDAVTLLKARALERAGLFKEALKALAPLENSTDVFALKSALYWRLGRPEDARQAAEKALDGKIEARAEAFNTLGNLAISGGELDLAITSFKRASALWQTLGIHVRLADALNNLAVAESQAGQLAAETFERALIAAGENPLLRARILLNQGKASEKLKDFTLASHSYEEAARLAEAASARSTAAMTWNNLGVLFHKQDQKKAARDAYERALELAREAGETRMLGMFMANLAELTENLEAWQEALHILEEAGHGEEARQYRAELTDDHPFKTYRNGA